MIDKNQYLSLCKDAEMNQTLYVEKARSNVVRWEYAGGKRYDTTPFWFERNREPRAPLNGERAAISYGFDADGQLCFVQSHLEESLERTHDRVINRRYSDGKLDSIEELTMVNGHPHRYVEFIVRNGMNPGQEWHFEEDYLYEHGQLTEINRNEYGYAGSRVHHHGYHLKYNQSGLLESINEKDSIIYVNISAEQAVQLRSEIKAGLLEESLNVIKRIGILVGENELCFIAIYLHDTPEAVIDPIFQAGLQGIRDEQLNDEEDLWTLWNSGNHPTEYQEVLSDDSLKAKFNLLMQYWEMNSDWSGKSENPVLLHHTWWDESKVLWQEVARELNHQNWKGILPVTETFVIFVDEEALDVSEGDLAKSVPADKLSILEGMGLLTR